MKKILENIGALFLFGVLLTGCNNNQSNVKVEIIPKPVEVVQLKGNLEIDSKSKIVFPTSHDNLAHLAAYTQQMIEQRTGLKLEICNQQEAAEGRNIYFDIDSYNNKNIDGYSLDISKKGVNISAQSATGLLYGVQSLRQLLPITDVAKITLPYLEVDDYPRFKWRGLHLDVSRHFFSVADVKRFLDLMAMYKLNVFHWHLTDDQGWRVEIKKYPKLTSVGAWRNKVGFEENQKRGFNTDDGKPYGGFYTQEQIKEVVAYAKKLGIEVVPEIDLPGHSMAALTAYPEYYCFDDEKLELWTKGGVSHGVFCAGNDGSYKFIEGVLDELLELFPSEMIHIGGDEAPKDNWRKCPRCQARIAKEGLKDEYELQSYFITRLADYLNKKGRKVLGWDEIMEGKGVDGAAIMAWRSVMPGIEAAHKGHDVIMTPSKYLYISKPQSVNDVTQTKGAVVSMRELYEFNPVPKELEEKYHKHIIGVQACQWSEGTPNMEVLEYKEYPRAIALAEVAWTPEKHINWDDFYSRVTNHNKQLLFYGVKGGARSYDVRIGIEPASVESAIKIGFKAEVPQPIYYTLNGEDPTKESLQTNDFIEIDSSCVVKACMFRPDGSRGRIAEREINFHKALVKKVIYGNNYSANYDGGGDYGLTNGVFELWQGFEKHDVDFVLDLGSVMEVSKISSNWFYDIADWVLRPLYVSYEYSIDGENYELLNKKVIGNPKGEYAKGIIKVEKALDKVKMRYIRVRAKNEGVNPKWHSNAGGASWLFVDEVVVN